MTDPFHGGLAASDDLALTGPLPEDPDTTETFNVWLYDGPHRTGVNFHPALQNGVMTAALTVFLPDGRILRGMDGPHKFTSPDRPESEHIKFHCKTPFRHWSYRAVDMPVWVTTAGEQAQGRLPERAPTTTVSLDIEGMTAAPPWIMGTLLPEAGAAVRGAAGLWIANRLRAGMSDKSRRYDQALRGEGTITFEGERHALNGQGLRGHVRGVRVLDGMPGHVWMGGVFPSGMTFGLLNFPRPDGGFAYSEAYIYKGGRLYPNRILYATQISRDPDRPEFAVELACDELGLTRIEGRDEGVLWWELAKWTAGGSGKHDNVGATGRIIHGLVKQAPLVMSQAVARFSCNGETGYGMDERSG